MMAAVALLLVALRLVALESVVMVVLSAGRLAGRRDQSPVTMAQADDHQSDVLVAPSW
jgi:hypothetical protein